MSSRISAFLLLAALITVSATLAAVAIAQNVHRPAPPRYCYPAASWAPAPDGLRPCVRVTRIYEDGSFTFSVSDARGTVRYTSGVGALDR